MTFNTTSPRLLAQRGALRTVNGRRGASSSQIVMRSRTPPKKPSLSESSSCSDIGGQTFVNEGRHISKGCLIAS